ncbi:MAG TPA: 3-keto-5-aminohexanoate cleavage protein [Gemmatimonadales bacterium]|nr:3-keto-5-aminohexanoate cleavage protein [Gemmatimonadales bacterium]
MTRKRAVRRRDEGVIVNLCPTGMVPDRAMTPHVPLTPAEIVPDVLRCIERGANLVHLHARDEAGHPHYSREIYARQIAGIREVHPDVTICVSLSGRNFGEFAQRADPLSLGGDLRPDMGSLTLSSLNFPGQASVNSPEMVRRLAETMLERGIRPELEVFDAGMVNYAHYLIGKGALQPPFYFNILLGNLAGAQAAPAQLAAILAELPEDSIWCLAGIGRQQLTANTLGLLFGDGVRVGLEDNIWYDDARTRLATNEELVERVGRAAALLERPVATPAEVRMRLKIAPLTGRRGFGKPLPSTGVAGYVSAP